jgi:hypothetical protein
VSANGAATVALVAFACWAWAAFSVSVFFRDDERDAGAELGAEDIVGVGATVVDAVDRGDAAASVRLLICYQVVLNSIKKCLVLIGLAA